MQSISLTVPYTADALGRAADMLHGMAIDLGHAAPGKNDSQAKAVALPAMTAAPDPDGNDSAGASLDPPAEPPAPASGATDPSEPTPSAESASPRVDTKGVPFDGAYCGNAADPFYATGKRAGQWKKRKGVDDAAYDDWYAQQLGEPNTDAPAEEFDTSSAFGGAPTADASLPKLNNAGELMAWVSEKQAAGLITQEDVTAAYAAAHVGAFQELFPPNDPAEIARKINAIQASLAERL